MKPDLCISAHAFLWHSADCSQGIAQGRAAAAGIGIIAKKPEESGKAVIMAAMVETYAILSLLISILIIYNI